MEGRRLVTGKSFVIHIEPMMKIAMLWQGSGKSKKGLHGGVENVFGSDSY